MGAVAMLVGCDLRRRWRALLVVTLLLGLSGGVVLTAVAGARRTHTAYGRLTEVLTTSHLSVEASPEYFEAIGALPEVEATAPASFVFVFVGGYEDEDFLTMAAVDERFNRTIDVPLIVEGRDADPGRPDEVVIDAETAERLDVDVGDDLDLLSLAPRQYEPLISGEDPGEPEGPKVDVTVVGLGRTEMDFTSGTSLVLFTPAFYGRYRDEVAHFDDLLLVRLRDGAAGLPAFERAVAEIVPASEGLIIETQAETVSEVRDATRVQAVSLLVFAAALGLALLVAVGQALARQTTDAGTDYGFLSALGVRRRQRFLALVVPGTIVAVAGSAVAVAVALAASPTMPIGFARQVEPSRGLDADWPLLSLGFTVIAVLVIGRVSVSAWRTSRGVATSRASRPSRMVSALADAGAPLALQTGVRLAFEPGRGRSAVPVRPALVGGVVGIAGLVAALTFGAALRWTVSEPVAFGLSWDTSVVGPRDPVELDRLVATLAAHEEVHDVAALSVLPIRLDEVPIQSYGIEAVKGGAFVTVLDGRQPHASNEVLVGSKTLDRHNLEVGDTVRAASLDGASSNDLTVVGRGVFPEFIHPAVPDSDTGSFNDFALLSREGSEALGETAGGEYFSLALVRWQPGTDAAAAVAQLDESGGGIMATDPPVNFVNLERVEAYPWVVAGFLVLIAAVATGHALAMSVRRRAADLAVLRTLGYDGGQVRTSIAWQATTLAIVGLALGIPLGLVLGRMVWTVVADRLGIDVHIPRPGIALLVLVPLVIAMSNVLALGPARRAARTRPAAALRSE